MSPSCVETTGFLPGVLSFPLRTLSPGESRSQAKQPVLPTSITYLTGRECCTNWPTSHTQSSTAWPQQPMGKIDTGFPTGLAMTGWSRGYGLGIEIPHTGSICSDRGYLGFLEINTAYPQNQHRLFPRFQNCSRSHAEVGSVHSQTIG
jgi:hypothetical protein